MSTKTLNLLVKMSNDLMSAILKVNSIKKLRHAKKSLTMSELEHNFPKELQNYNDHMRGAGSVNRADVYIAVIWKNVARFSELEMCLILYHAYSS